MIIARMFTSGKLIVNLALIARESINNPDVYIRGSANSISLAIKHNILQVINKMPTYDYKCKFCGYKFEAFQSIVSEPLKTCPKCRGPVERLISPGAGLIFKGSGFYITDYKHKSNDFKLGKRCIWILSKYGSLET